MITALGVTELKLLLRNRTAAALAVLMPLATGVYFALAMGGADHGWTMVVTLQLLFSFGFTVYVTVTTSLTARRQDLYLKRLRTGAASDVVVLTGILLPVVVLGLAQAVALLGISVAAGAPMPARPELLVVALLLGAALGCAAGVATSGLTGTAELAQITTAPFFSALVVGGLMGLGGGDDVRVLLVPGSGLGVLTQAAWGGPPTRSASRSWPPPPGPPRPSPCPSASSAGTRAGRRIRDGAARLGRTRARRERPHAMPPRRRRPPGIVRPRHPDDPTPTDPPTDSPPTDSRMTTGGWAPFLTTVAPAGGIGVAFLLYLGWRLNRYTDPLAAITPDTLPSEHIYALRGFDFVVAWAVLVLPAGVLLAWLHVEAVHRLRPRALRRWGRAGQVVGLLVLFGAGGLVQLLPSDGEVTGLVFPLTTYVGTLLVVYGTVLVRGSRPETRPVSAVLRIGVAFLVAALTLWVVDKVAQYQGQRAVRELLSTEGALFDAVVHSKSRLPVHGVGVVELKVDSPDSEYGYEYRGLRLMKPAAGRYYFVDEEWTRRRSGSVIVLPDTDSILVRFTRQSDGRP